MEKVAEKEFFDNTESQDASDSGHVVSAAEAPSDRVEYKDLSEFFDVMEEEVKGLVRVMIQSYAEEEFHRYVGALPYERTASRRDYRNGSVTREVMTRFGLVEGVRIPRGRKGGFLSTLLSRFRRKEKKITKIVAEMFTCGVSTRKVKRITKLLWGKDIGHAEVSRMNQTVRSEMMAWLNRPIQKKFTHLLIDGVMLKVRRRLISKEALLCAVGITEDGHKEFLGFVLGGRESQRSWEFCLMQLIRRGLDPRGIKLIISDGCPGMLNAIESVFPHVEHQRCLFHKMGNLQKKCPKSLWPLVKAKLDNIYYANSKMEAEDNARSFITEYENQLPSLVECLTKDLNNCLTYMSHPYRRWKRIRTTNLIERCFKEFRRRINCMETFPTEESCVRIMFTLARLQNDNWEGKPIANF